MQQTYQRLKSKNRKAAEALALALKLGKTMSEETFGDIYCEFSPKTSRGGSFNTLIETTKQFLFDHRVMTRQKINGLIIYVATQKCFRSKIENMFLEYQDIPEHVIDSAIEYQEINDGTIPANLEGKVIAKNIFALEGKLAEKFIEVYETVMEYCKNSSGTIDEKYAILQTFREIKELRKY